MNKINRHKIIKVLFNQKDLVEALEKAERRIKREKKEKEKAKQSKEISNNN